MKLETIGSYLAHDHGRLDALFEQVQLALAEGHWTFTERAFACFGDALERHLLIEERIVFPAYESALCSLAGPTSKTRSEHLRIRAIVQRLAYCVSRRQASDVANHLDTLNTVLQQHHRAEEDVLYPMIERVLAERQPKVIAAMHRFGAMDLVARAA